MSLFANNKIDNKQILEMMSNLLDKMEDEMIMEMAAERDAAESSAFEIATEE